MPFTPISTSLGALLLHLSTTNFHLCNGRILGVSSILGNSLFSPNKDNVPVVAGMALSTAAAYFLAPGMFEYLGPLGEGFSEVAGLGSWTPLVAGLLVGFGTFFSSGCTSGHMLCGLPRFSPRSFISTLIFFSSAVLTKTFVPFTHPSTPICPNDSFLSCFTPPPLPTTSNLLTSAALVSSVYAGNVAISHLLPASPHSRTLSAIYSGAVFALGLIVSGMANPAKVSGFLHMFGHRTFDPSLLMVMLFALAPNVMVWQRAIRARLQTPKLDKKWYTPTRTDIDLKLLGGSIVFGLGWGLMGICPGPGLVTAVAGAVSGAARTVGITWLAGFWAGRGAASMIDRVSSKMQNAKKGHVLVPKTKEPRYTDEVVDVGAGEI